ncbi:MAG: phytoene/squalene synthase family protein [Chitinophagales bacterium]|nr:phytoene/squalene synthase family protein [Chitinophagales bacterium]HAE13547.1 phytoene synthase [Bacteroidota bacterium]MCB9021354.1 phytoene/squalene synthase family protein [Chitinophagales bacterium]MCB9031691.1 phytoene/squalene synthase family protein [Chitinophagales bacterium]HPE97853.1 phytoene/squalene synthase family protein [Chitinophagales bacterium]
MMQLFHDSSFACSKKITELYSTSFTLGIRALHPDFRDAIFGIYGFVRYADEIVDTFHDHDKKYLLDSFREDTWKALDGGISLNPVLHAFQLTVNKYQIDRKLIEAFLHSMEMDLYFADYKREHYDEYIYGSAEVVGLMCLKVFCNGEEEQYNQLVPAARSLGAAFQKVNFLRDMKSDYQDRGRVYFPQVDFSTFSEEMKRQIEEEIAADFEKAYEGIRQLPARSRFGVYLAYRYYLALFRKIRTTPAERVLEARIRVSNPRKLALYASSYLQHSVIGV